MTSTLTAATATIAILGFAPATSLLAAGRPASALASAPLSEVSIPAPRAAKAAAPRVSRAHGPRVVRLDPHADAPPDLSGRKRVGVASYYARSFAGKQMANGAPMDPRGDNAASRTLPLGTTAKVTNLETGKSAVVRIEDRGPYVEGRIVDLSPATARKIGITRRKGISKVEVAPIVVPLPDGRIRLGAGTRAEKSARAPARQRARSPLSG